MNEKNQPVEVGFFRIKRSDKQESCVLPLLILYWRLCFSIYLSFHRIICVRLFGQLNHIQVLYQLS